MSTAGKPSPRRTPADTQASYLQLETNYAYEPDKHAIKVSTSLYSRVADTKPAQGLLGKISAKLHQAVTAFREWRAKNWVVSYVNTNLQKTDQVEELLRSIKDTGRVKQKDFYLALLQDQLYWSKDQQSGGIDAPSMDKVSLRQDHKEKVANELMISEMKALGFEEKLILAFMEYIRLGDSAVLPSNIDTYNQFREHFYHIRVDSRIRNDPFLKIIEMKVDQLFSKLYIVKETIRKNKAAAAESQKSSAEDHSLPTTGQRKVLRYYLSQAWGILDGREIDLNQIGMGTRKKAFLNYLEKGISGASPDDLHHLKWFAKGAKLDPKLYEFPTLQGVNGAEGLGRIYKKIISELSDLDVTTAVQIDVEKVKKALAKIIVGSDVDRNAKLNISSNSSLISNYAIKGFDVITNENKDGLRKLLPLFTSTVFSQAKLDSEEQNHMKQLLENLKADLARYESAQSKT